MLTDAAMRDHLSHLVKGSEFEVCTDLLMREAVECRYLMPMSPADASRRDGSRLAGNPALPPGVNWPAGLDREGRETRYADFLAQINLADVGAIGDMTMPTAGLLWLFIRSLPLRGQPQVVILSGMDRDLTERTAPADKPLLYGELDGSQSIRFEQGVSLPFGATRFTDLLAEATHTASAAWETLAEMLTPADAVGQFGGFAYSYDGYDLSRLITLKALGRPEYVEQYHYDSIADMEQSQKRVPAFVRNEEQLAIWRKSFDDMRPRVEWAEAHQREIHEWKLLVRINANRKINFSIGDSLPLWVFIETSDLAAGKFDNVVATLSA
jgi:uncharacterized protein YwqG